jgi:endoglucanase
MRSAQRLSILLAFVPVALMAQAPPSGYNQLQDIWIVQSNPPGEWAGGDLTTSGSSVPLDTTQMYNGRPSLSYQVTGPNQWWWVSIFSGSDNHAWVDYSLEYYQPGFLEFDVKGAQGGERFIISFNDEEPTRNPVNLSSDSVNVGNYVTVSTSWQHVRIPLTDFSVPAGFEFRQMHSVQIAESNDSPSYARQFWINGIRFTSPSKEHSFPTIKVNQIGYEPTGTKYGLITGFGEILSATAGTPFHVLRASDNKSVYDGTLLLESEYDSLSGDKVLSADFSALTTPGTYLLHVDAPGIEDSLRFQIGFGVFNKVLRDSMRYYYFQRQGIAIEEPHGEGFTRPLGTPSETAAYFQSSGPNGPTSDVSHGWYDAGDLGKYVSNSPSVMVDLMDAYASFPWIFYDGQNNIPESGNGKPDILDEVKWELDWLLKMQDPASGGFYAIAAAGDCAANVNPCRTDSATGSYILDVVNGQPNVRPTPETANAVAALAHAANIYKTYDSKLATSYLAAAESGWAYLTANPQVIPSNGLTYGSTDDSDGRLWAAAELFRTTGKPVYNTYFLAHYQKYDPNFNQPNATEFDVPFRAFFAYNLSRRADCQERTWFQQHYALWRAGQLARMKSPWRNFLFGYWWGSNAVDLGAVSTLVMGDRAAGYTSSPDVLDAAKNQMNYILGVNPLRHSYVVGAGADSATTIFSGIYWGYGVHTPPAGYMGGGPNWYSSPWFSRFQARAFADSNVDYQINENDIGYNVGLVFTAAVAAAGELNTISPELGELTCNRQNQTCSGKVTLTNTGMTSIRGPFRLLLTNLTPGVSVLEGHGQIGGSAYVTTEDELLEPGESMRVHVKFSNPLKKTISFAPVVEVRANSSSKAAQCGAALGPSGMPFW